MLIFNCQPTRNGKHSSLDLTWKWMKWVEPELGGASFGKLGLLPLTHYLLVQRRKSKSFLNESPLNLFCVHSLKSVKQHWMWWCSQITSPLTIEDLGDYSPFLGALCSHPPLSVSSDYFISLCIGHSVYTFVTSIVCLVIWQSLLIKY